MFRFTIRDLLWLMVVAGLVVAWWMDRERQRQDRLAIQRLLLAAEADRDSTALVMHELMKDLDVIHPGWRKAKWQEIPKPLSGNTDGRGKAWSQFQATQNAASTENTPKK